jgi:hypothetical protein
MGEKDRIYSKSKMRQHAEGLEGFLNVSRKYVVIENNNIDSDQYEHYCQVINEAIENLEKGKGHKVYSQKRYRDYYKIDE